MVCPFRYVETRLCTPPGRPSAWLQAAKQNGLPGEGGRDYTQYVSICWCLPPLYLTHRRDGDRRGASDLARAAPRKGAPAVQQLAWCDAYNRLSKMLHTLTVAPKLELLDHRCCAQYSTSVNSARNRES